MNPETFPSAETMRRAVESMKRYMDRIIYLGIDVDTTTTVMESISPFIIPTDITTTVMLTMDSHFNSMWDSHLSLFKTEIRELPYSLIPEGIKNKILENYKDDVWKNLMCDLEMKVRYDQYKDRLLDELFKYYQKLISLEEKIPKELTDFFSVQIDSGQKLIL